MTFAKQQTLIAGILTIITKVQNSKYKRTDLKVYNGV